MMIERHDRFVYTDQIRPGMVAMLKNGLVVIGVKDKVEALQRINEHFPEHKKECPVATTEHSNNMAR